MGHFTLSSVQKLPEGEIGNAILLDLPDGLVSFVTNLRVREFVLRFPLVENVFLDLDFGRFGQGFGSS